MAKIIDLFRHTDKDDSGRHISYAGAKLAYDTGQRLYGGYSVAHGFHGPLIHTNETLVAMWSVGGKFFENMQIHGPINGLGSDELFERIFTDDVRAAIKAGASNMEGVLQNIDPQALKEFEAGAQSALRSMFDQMADGQHGVGIFHDPTISMLAKSLGMENAQSLGSMEAIRFTLDNEGGTTASFLE